MKVLIPGISGKIAQLVAELLHAKGHQVLGIDRRPWRSAPDGMEIFHADIRKRAAEEVFRVHRPDVVIHMATVTHLDSNRAVERDRINLGGTRAVFDHSIQYGVKHVVFVGRHTYYGAAPDSPLYHSEGEPPLALSTYPELADLVAADLYAGTALWRSPQIKTCLLRLCYSLGPQGQGTLGTYLRGPRVPTILGFDQLFQFLHERDIARAIVAAVDHQLHGIFNVAGPQPVPLSVLIEETGRTALPLPEFLLSHALGRFGLPRLAAGALNHIKYSIVMDASAFKKAVDFVPEFDELRTMHQYREAFELPRDRA